jgi:hypothetical protein
VLTDPNGALSASGVTGLGECYKQLNSSVGQFGTATLQAATKAIESTSRHDEVYRATDKILTGLDFARDKLAGQIKGELEAAAFGDTSISSGTVRAQTFACNALIDAATELAQHLS